MKILNYVILVGSFIGHFQCQHAPSSAKFIRQPAEFEPTKTVYLLWPNYDHKQGFSNAKVTCDIIKALVPSVSIGLIVRNDSIEKIVRNQLDSNILQKITFYHLPYGEFWARDILPNFVFTEKGLATTDFSFNNWGYSDTSAPEARLDEQLDEKLAASLHLPSISSNVITEGGDHETNGKGTFILCESVEQTRNPNRSLKQIESEFARVTGAKKVIWMKKGVREDDNTTLGVLRDAQNRPIYTVITTNGHTDEFVRFANPTTILLAQVDSADLFDPIAAETDRRMAENFKILENATDQDGNPFKIIRVPLPPAIVGTMKPNDGVYEIISNFKYQNNHVFPKGKPIYVIAATSYLNFLIANDCVLTAKYGSPNRPDIFKKRDEAALKILKTVFPDKKMIQIDALSVNWGGGGIHCITKNQPRL